MDHGFSKICKKDAMLKTASIIGVNGLSGENVNLIIESYINEFENKYNAVFSERGEMIRTVHKITDEMETIKILHAKRREAHEEKEKYYDHEGVCNKCDKKISLINKKLRSMKTFQQLYDERAEASKCANDLKTEMIQLKKNNAGKVLLGYANRRLEENRKKCTDLTKVRECSVRITIPQKYEELFDLLGVTMPETIGELDLFESHLRNLIIPCVPSHFHVNEVPNIYAGVESVKW